MKKYIKLCMALLSFTLLCACSDNDYTETDKGRNELALTADVATSTLDENSYAAEAVTLKWTTGNNAGTGNRISYLLELAQSGTNFAEPYVAVQNETQVYDWSMTQEGLNSLILDKWGGTAGTPITIEARVTASIIGVEEHQTSTTSFTVTPYQPVSRHLYLIGDVTPNGWSADNATDMTRTDNGIFTWEGKLKVGSYKFITQLGRFLPSYNKGDDGKLVLRTDDSQPDEKYTIDEEHDYRITANILTGELTIVKTEGVVPAYQELFFVGNATGWGFVDMNRDVLDPYLFRYGRYFGSSDAGEFKFGTAKGWESMYKATQDNAPYTDTSMEFVSGFEPDRKWVLSASETGMAYKICIDIRQGKERMMMRPFTPYETIYLVGDATPNGWDLGNATPMTVSADSPYIFTWTGRLSAGEMKFSCDKQSDWNGAWFLCVNGEGAEPTGNVEKMLFINKSDEYLKGQYLDINIGDVDRKWKITTAGTYTITLNQLEETVSIVKQ